VWRSHRLLADGREIIYYDETPGLGRAGVADSRDLPPSQVPGTSGPGAAAGAESELRFDPLLGEWVIFAAQRQERTFLPAADHCPLCPSGPGRLTEIPAPGYDVVVFENRFPALRGSDSRPSQVPPHRAVSQHPAVSDPGVAGFGLAGSFGEAGALSARLPGYGRCEVICFTQEHDAPFASLSNRRAGTVLAAWADRTSVLGAIPGIEHVYCFENAGEEVGVTLSHPHGQIYALPFVPPLTRRLTASAHAYRARQGRNLFDDLVASELADGRRIVARNDHWVAFVPSAARWPFEVMLFPAARVADITGLDVAAQVAFCDIYLDVLRRFDALFGTPMPHVAAWQQAGVHDQAGRAEFAAHVQVLGVLRTAGRRKFVAGTEVGAQVWSNDVLPETAARMLRAAAR
jgi:UDPglucose--hexose-1-phosphate uridylyltransferase